MAKKMGDATAKPNVTPETFLEQYRIIASAKRTVDEANSVYRHRLKNAGKLGIDTKQLLAVMRLKKLETDVIEIQFRTQNRYLAWLGTPIGTQASMFEEAEAEPNANARETFRQGEIEQAGYDAGLHNQAVESCPYPQGSEHAQVWVKGLHAGREFMSGSGLPAKGGDKVVAIGRKRRGGPRGETIQ